jgi:hypothetical protein
VSIPARRSEPNRTLPGWRATLYRDHDFRGATIEITQDVPDLGALRGGCSGSLDDCISSIRVFRADSVAGK